MRLTHIKLAGFKSFVEPTTISVPGNLVGVVGPNGCGKSNIIDAVRWVLGESRASALRGDSMQDVIFNGSSLRNPVARASVELSFDNNSGKASGVWSQYAEISVKRILQREGESIYFINNTHVRRRDVQDIFLGTGLGPRAYAIVEQGMISRIIEARPEDLRVFLEEAAGVSKYKERRRESEHRLSDTRENLARVNDVRIELESQIEKLEKQADVAKRYQELATERQTKQNLLALLRRNEAQAEAERQAREIARASIELEAETAGLRQVERGLEQIRSEHYAAADALNAAQGELYEANAEVSRLESEIRFVSETRQRVEVQLTQARTHREAAERQASELREGASLWRSRLEEGRARLAAARERRAREVEKLPQAEQTHRALQQQLAEQRGRIAQAEQVLQLEQAHASHAEKNLQGLEAREQRLLMERDERVAPDAQVLSRLCAELEQSQSELARQEDLLQRLEQAREQLDAERSVALERLRALERDLSALEAKLLTLQSIQRQVDANQQIHDWLERHGLSAATRLWQRVNVEWGWETAVEAVLRERLHALEIGDAESLQRLLEDPPRARVIAYCLAQGPELDGESGLTPLSSLARAQEERYSAVVRAWLAGYYAVEGIPTLQQRLALAPRAVLVNRDGHQFSRYGVSFYAPDQADSGILTRQREIDSLVARLHEEKCSIEADRSDLEAITIRLEEHMQGLSTLRAAGSALKQRHHEQQLDQVRRSEERERYLQRSSQIELELAEIAGHKLTEQATREGAVRKALEAQEELDRLRAGLAAVEEAHSRAEGALDAQRRTLQGADREEQDESFYDRECSNKISDIDRSIQKLLEDISEADNSIVDLERESAGLQDQALRQQLQQALNVRSAREQALSLTRARQDETSEQMRSAEESRLAHEQKLQPLRDRISDLRLKEQAARLSFEQYAVQLSEAGADETVLAAFLKEGQKAAPLQGEITRLANAINDLGAVNMAAVEELAVSRERKQYLDAQYADLSEALDILEGAIRRIDRETRDLLQATFNSVNGHFGELFPVLFGGGEARLEMTGEEILDCGVEVIARPPGKKNTTIHLLSGGEKALTAIALVFSIFQLNPAPFCLLDEVDAPLDDANTERFCELVSKMSTQTQFLFISHNKITMEMASQLIGVTMQEQGVSRVVAVDIEEALKLREPVAA